MGVEDWEGLKYSRSGVYSLWSLQDFGATSDNSKVQVKVGLERTGGKANRRTDWDSQSPES